tara:strand:+ start:220 stop:495 length:276 start_codon:yes stop_codon:yes gene_type:complete
MKIDKSKLLGFSNATMPSVPMVGIKPRIDKSKLLGFSNEAVSSIPMVGMKIEMPGLDEQLVVADTDTDSASDIADNTSQDQSDSSDNSEIA